MDGLRQWALCLIISAAAVAFVIIITPRGATDKTVRAVAGIFVISAIFTPLADMTFNFDFTETAADVEDDYDALAASVLDVCRSAAENAILSAAQENGIGVNEICITADIDAEGCIIIHAVNVEISNNNADNPDEIEKIFSNAIGVPVEVKTE